jgi:hypothetical protein
MIGVLDIGGSRGGRVRETGSVGGQVAWNIETGAPCGDRARAFRRGRWCRGAIRTTVVETRDRRRAIRRSVARTRAPLCSGLVGGRASCRVRRAGVRSGDAAGGIGRIAAEPCRFGRFDSRIPGRRRPPAVVRSCDRWQVTVVADASCDGDPIAIVKRGGRIEGALDRRARRGGSGRCFSARCEVGGHRLGGAGRYDRVSGAVDGTRCALCVVGRRRTPEEPQ